MTVRPICRLAALLLLLPALAACATAPATGRSFFTGGLSQADEAELGAKQHKEIVKQFGGAYDDPALARYVSGLGGLLARTSELPDLSFTFTVLDSPMVNAFALPGGYVYVTRGLLALADNEAELAGVLSHEIGHVTARHAAERYGQTMAAKLASAGLGLLFGRASGQAANTVSALALSSWSRDQEFEADLLGVRYLSRGGFDPGAMGSFLARLQANSRLQAKLRGQDGAADEFSFLQTHPRTGERIDRAVREAGAKSAAAPVIGRAVYLGKIDGLVFGDSPAHGLVRGRKFLHPELRIAFEVPEGFTLLNGQKKVAAKGPGDAVVIFDMAKREGRSSMVRYISEVWAEGVALDDLEPITINGLAAATGAVRVPTREGRRDFRLVAIRGPGDRVFRFQFVTPAERTAGLAEGLKRTTYSFRRLGAAEAARLRPYRLRLHRVRPGDTPARIARRLPFEDHRLDRFLVLNGLDGKAALAPGRTVKVVE
jgi:predicted Zn-dependent protease